MMSESGQLFSVVWKDIHLVVHLIMNFKHLYLFSFHQLSDLQSMSFKTMPIFGITSLR